MFDNSDKKDMKKSLYILNQKLEEVNQENEELKM